MNKYEILISELITGIEDFVWSLSLEKEGEYLPHKESPGSEGISVSLGYSCFALKILYTINQWGKISKKKQELWINHIHQFQNTCLIPKYCHYKNNAFIDPPVIKYLDKDNSLYSFLKKKIKNNHEFSQIEMVIYAETKQAIATLAQIGVVNKKTYYEFPITKKALLNRLDSYDWTQPWGAGGQTAALAVFISTQAPRFLEFIECQKLTNTLDTFISNLADPRSGSYFSGPDPDYNQLINGAMKIISALDWINIPIHYPERLIDTVLMAEPLSDGCHVVDAVYVLYKCCQNSDYRKNEIQQYCIRLLQTIMHHKNKDGGFSFYIGNTQNIYYGVPIGSGREISDLHGTCLFVWAIAMIMELLGYSEHNWKVIKP